MQTRGKGLGSVSMNGLEGELMKIISLNVNNFGGKSPKPLLRKFRRPGVEYDFQTWNAEVDYWRISHRDAIERNVRAIAAYLSAYDVVFLHEVDTNCDSWRLLLDTTKESFALELANGMPESAVRRGRKSISCVLIKKGLEYKMPLDNPWDSQRHIILDVGGVRLIGVHMSYSLLDWDILIRQFEKKKADDVLIIGDLNVYARDNDRREKFDALQEAGAVDLWLRQGEPDDTPTADTNCRIDYALASESLAERTRMEILHGVREEGCTDHSAAAVTIA